MSAGDWVALGALGLLAFNTMATIAVSRWGKRMAHMNQIIQLDRELEQHLQDTTQ